MSTRAAHLSLPASFLCHSTTTLKPAQKRYSVWSLSPTPPEHPTSAPGSFWLSTIDYWYLISSCDLEIGYSSSLESALPTTMFPEPRGCWHMAVALKPFGRCSRHGFLSFKGKCCDRQHLGQPLGYLLHLPTEQRDDCPREASGEPGGTKMPSESDHILSHHKMLYPSIRQRC